MAREGAGPLTRDASLIFRPMTLTVLLVPLWISSIQADNLAKQAQNPVADLISLPLQNNSVRFSEMVRRIPQGFFFRFWPFNAFQPRSASRHCLSPL